MRLLQTCTIRSHVRIDRRGAAGLKTDCSSGVGASGGALLVPGPDGYEVVGVQSSIGRGKKCSFSVERCYSYAVSTSLQIRSAIDQLR
jgi:hypothetical protein